MDMLETYLEAVAAHLPRDADDDIVAELRDTLLTQFEDREEVLGRPLTDEEQEEILRAMGHPLVVAAQYRKGPQTLIGPELFPYWLFAARAGLIILAAIYAFTLAIALVSNPFDGGGAAIARSIHGYFGAGLTLVGALTVAGGVMEHLGLRPPYLDTWRVKDLQILKIGDPAAWASKIKAGPGAGSAPRFNFGWPSFSRRSVRPRPPRIWPGSDALVGVISGIVFVAWWVGLLHFPGLGQVDLRGASVAIEAGPIWATLFLPILFYALAQIVVDALGVIRPGAIQMRAALQVPVALAGLALTWGVIRAGTWFTLAQGEARVPVGGDLSLLDPQAMKAMKGLGQTLPDLATGLGVIVMWGLAITLLTFVFKLLKSLWLVFAGRR